MTGRLPILLLIFVIYLYNVTICNGQVFKKQILPISICNMSHVTIWSCCAWNAECTVQFEKENGKGGRRLEVSGPRALLVAVD